MTHASSVNVWYFNLARDSDRYRSEVLHHGERKFGNQAQRGQH